MTRTFIIEQVINNAHIKIIFQTNKFQKNWITLFTFTLLQFQVILPEEI